MIKGSLFISLFFTFYGCNSLKCDNLKENNLEGLYKNKSSAESIIINKDGSYLYQSSNKTFKGKWLISKKSHCEITFNDWKGVTKNDSSCSNGCYNTILL